jgi:hypothetical protein
VPKVPPSVTLDPLGYPGYVATRDGRVLTLRAATDPRPLKPYPHPRSGNMTVALVTRDGRRRVSALARLILTAFGRPSPKGLGFVVRHKNGDKTDCRLVNLAWRTKVLPDKSRAIKMIRGLMRRYGIRPEDLT